MAGTFEYADKMGADKIVFVAPDEWGEGNVRIKNMGEGEQTDVPVGELAEWAGANL